MEHWSDPYHNNSQHEPTSVAHFSDSVQAHQHAHSRDDTGDEAQTRCVAKVSTAVHVSRKRVHKYMALSHDTEGPSI